MKRPSWMQGPGAALVAGLAGAAAIYGGVLLLEAHETGSGIAMIVLGALLAGFAYDAARSR